MDIWESDIRIFVLSSDWQYFLHQIGDQNIFKKLKNPPFLKLKGRFTRVCIESIKHPVLLPFEIKSFLTKVHTVTAGLSYLYLLPLITFFKLVFEVNAVEINSIVCVKSKEYTVKVIKICRYFDIIVISFHFFSVIQIGSTMVQIIDNENWYLLLSAFRHTGLPQVKINLSLLGVFHCTVTLWNGKLHI